jgi:hypothetical protein
MNTAQDDEAIAVAREGVEVTREGVEVARKGVLWAKLGVYLSAASVLVAIFQFEAVKSWVYETLKSPTGTTHPSNAPAIRRFPRPADMAM